MIHTFLSALLFIVISNSIVGPCTLTASSSASLSEALNEAFEEVLQLSEATWGLGIVDLTTGKTITRNGDRQFQMESPHLPVAVCGIELSNNGEMSLDSLIGRNELFWEKLHWAQQGGRGACQAVIWSIQKSRLNEWIAQGGYTGTVINGVQLIYPDCPSVDPNYITVENGLKYLQIVYDNLEQSSVRSIGENPPLSDALRETLGLNNTVYGWIDETEDWKHLFIIADHQINTDFGIVILTEDLSSPEIADQAFGILFEPLSD